MTSTAGTVTVTNSGNIRPDSAEFRWTGCRPALCRPTMGSRSIRPATSRLATSASLFSPIPAPSRVTANNVTSGFHGIDVSSLSGNIAVTTTGTINANSTGNGIKIDTGGEFLTVNVQSGSVTAADGDGIFVRATAAQFNAPHPDSNIGVTVNSGATVTASNPVEWWGIEALHISAEAAATIYSSMVAWWAEFLPPWLEPGPIWSRSAARQQRHSGRHFHKRGEWCDEHHQCRLGDRHPRRHPGAEQRDRLDLHDEYRERDRLERDQCADGKRRHQHLE